MATRVRMLEPITGTRNGAYWPGVGEEIDLTEPEAAKLIAQGRAEAAGKPARKTGTRST